jgi:hypothetical protein
MIDATSWTQIKKDWLRGCRMVEMDGGECSLKVDSVDGAIKSLDEALKKFKGQ